MYGMLGVDNLSWNHGRRQRGGQWCLASPFEIGAPPFHFWPPGCYIHPTLHFKNMALPAAKSWRRACLEHCDHLIHF